MYLIFCYCFWLLFITLLSWNIFNKSKQACTYLNQLHQIPCSRCIFFTGKPQLKCTVDPLKAMSLEATNCQSFEQKYYE